VKTNVHSVSLIFTFSSCVSHASIEENEANFAGIRAKGDKEFTGEITTNSRLELDLFKLNIQYATYI
jgi:hypothetical protein